MKVWKKKFTSRSAVTTAVLVALFSLQTVTAADYVRGTIQTTDYGQVQGSLDKNQILSWKGIPYAKPPVGELRWKAPENPDAWTGVKEAIVAPDVFVQTNNRGGASGTEENLTLTIYRPDTEEKNLPVFVYIHGGNNQTGSAKDLDPTAFIQKTPSVVVLMDYRLGLLGFNNLPALKTGNGEEDSGNYALLDIAKSLEWIQENIDGFGGNPKNVTLTGFSAGGRDAMVALISPIFKGKFQKAISFSGGLTVSDPIESQKLLAGIVAKLVVEDKVKETKEEAEAWLLSDAEEVREYLYALPAERLAGAIGSARIRMTAFPHLFGDGVVIPKEGFDTKKFNDVPLMMLTGSTEFSYYLINDAHFAAAKKDGSLLKNEELLKEFRFANKYGGELYRDFNTELGAKKLAGAYHAPMYTTEIKWGSNPEIVGTEMAEYFGSHHGIFTWFLTESPVGSLTYKSYPNAYANEGAKELAKTFQQYVGNFIQTGNPNKGSHKGLTEWKAWSQKKGGAAQLVLDADAHKASAEMNYKHSTTEEILAKVDADTTLSPERKEEIIKEVMNGRWFSQPLDAHYNNDTNKVQQK